jgi:hypothetical protein
MFLPMFSANVFREFTAAKHAEIIEAAGSSATLPLPLAGHDPDF